MTATEEFSFFLRMWAVGYSAGISKQIFSYPFSERSSRETEVWALARASVCNWKTLPGQPNGNVNCNT